jgi:DNA invertase Pin-like site-specific DNA recombinase
MPYTIAKYLRISAEDIDLDGFDKYESNSIANQRAYLDDFIARVPEFKGCEVLEAIDDGRTGTNFLRPGVQNLIEMAQSGKVNCIVVKDLSRWGRNYLEVGDFLEQKFPAWGVRFISINDMYDSATLIGVTSGMDIAFRNLIYDLYSQDLSEKVRSAKDSAAKNGKNCNAEAFYGYIKNPNDTRQLIIDEPAAEVVRRIYDLAAHDYSTLQIAKTLNDENVPTPQERKKQLGSRHRWTSGEATFWYSSIICLILKDERYTGKLIYGKKRRQEVGKQDQQSMPKSEWIVVPGAIPAVITDELFQVVQQNVGKRRKSYIPKQPTKLLFTRKLRCAYCGMSLKAIHRKHGVKLQCDTGRSTDKYGCEKFCVYEKDIADTVLSALHQQIAFADEAREKLAAREKQLAPSIEKLQTQIVQLQRLIEKSKTSKMALWEKYHIGEISAEGYQRENEKADEHAAQSAAKIPELQARIRELEMESGRENVFVERFSKQAGIQEITRAIVEEFISEIKVYAADRIEIVFNYADEYEKLVAIFDGDKKKRRAGK